MPCCPKRDNIEQDFFSCAMLSVVQWLTDNFYEENNLCKVVLTMVVQLCIGILSRQCCSIHLRQKNMLMQCWPRTHRHVFAGKFGIQCYLDLSLPTLHNKIVRSAILEIKNDKCKIVKIIIFRSLSREHFLSK